MPTPRRAAKVSWVKQLTRENTLLDRSLRTVAYRQSVAEVGRASIARSPVVGFGRVTSLYYDPSDYRRQQATILREFRKPGVDRIGEAIVALLEAGYRWGRSSRRRRPNRRSIGAYFETFMRHHAHARGAIVYGYWGEPAITAALRRRLVRRVPSTELDVTVSTLSSPRQIGGLLGKLYHPSPTVARQQQRLVRQLRLGRRERELVAMLSWCTCLYELGERVASFLYDELLANLRRFAGSSSAFEELQWYDPESLTRYFRGERLSRRALDQRRRCYVLRIVRGKLVVVSGPAAERFVRRQFPEPPATAGDLRGTVASRGRASGTVRVVITRADQLKMRPGDILVSTMTTPRLMAAVRQAAAIVTDEGGMTAHAAIVSRELGIPCVVGTKVATKVFKDGDVVEVDATRGVVRKVR